MAFDGLDGVAEENVLSTVREKLEAPYQGRTLLLIDSVDMPPEADEGLREIEHWGCDVLVTTRFPLGEGFRNIAVPLLSEEASRALFVQHDPYLKAWAARKRRRCIRCFRAWRGIRWRSSCWRIWRR